jgi:translation initiation factor 2B subunit (eIF-2B alpha/beta/delta family)
MYMIALICSLAGISDISTNVIIMQTAEIIQQLEKQWLTYQDLVSQCVDAINQLINYKPDGFEVAFLIRGVKSFSMPIPASEREFMLSFFISWRLYYQRKLEDTAAALWTLKSKAV